MDICGREEKEMDFGMVEDLKTSARINKEDGVWLPG
jgi:hypothetical protein